MKNAFLAPFGVSLMLLSGCDNDHLQLETRQIATLCAQQQPLAQVDVVLHNADGSVLSQHRTDESGKLDIEWPDGATHLTVAWQGQHSQIYSLLNFNGGDAGVFSFSSQAQNQLCNCKTLQLQSDDLLLTMPEYQLQSQRVLTQPLASVEVCKTSQESYRPLELMLVPPGAGQGYATSRDISQSSTSLRLSMADFSSRTNAVTLQSNLPVQQVQSYSIDAQGNRHFVMLADISKGQLPQWVNSVPGALQMLSLRNQKIISSNDKQQVRYQQRHDTQFSATSGNLSVTLADSQQKLADSAPALIEQWQKGSAGRYDFSANSGYSQLQFTYQARGTNGRSLSWQIQGPLAGDLPWLRLPAGYAGTLEQSAHSYSVTLQGYANGWSLAQLRSELVDLSRGKLLPNDPRLLNYREESLSLLLK